MTQLLLTVPRALQPNSTEDPKIATDLTLIQAWANGNIDASNISSAVASGLIAARPPAPALGSFYFATDTVTLYYYTGTGWAAVATPGPAVSQAVGSMMQYAGASDPVDSDSVTRWLICDGRPISRTTYAALFAAIGGTYGNGDGSSTFNIPDMRGRVPVGVDSGGVHLPTLHPALGASAGGEEKHVLADPAEIPAHSHAISDPGHTHSYTDPSHIHAFAGGNSVPGSTGGIGQNSPNGVTGSFDTPWSPSGWNTVGATGSAPTGITINSHSTGITTTQPEGSGGGHNNVQPYLGVNHIVKVL